MMLTSSPEARDGVSAQGSAGTPSPLKDRGTLAALEVLEFPAALELVAGYAAGPEGAAAVRHRLPSADPAWIAAELGGDQ